MNSYSTTYCKRVNRFKAFIRRSVRTENQSVCILYSLSDEPRVEITYCHRSVLFATRIVRVLNGNGIKSVRLLFVLSVYLWTRAVRFAQQTRISSFPSASVDGRPKIITIPERNRPGTVWTRRFVVFGIRPFTVNVVDE